MTRSDGTMTRRGLLLLCAALVVAIAHPSAAAGETRTVTKDYVAGDMPSTCLVQTTPGLGGACFEPLPTEDSVRVWPRDVAMGYDIRFGVVFLNAAGNIILRAGSCPSARVTIPIGTAMVLVEAYYTGGLFSEACIGKYPPTTGSFEVTFSGYRAPPSSRVEIQAYVAGNGAYVRCGSVSVIDAPNLGGACFTPRPGETRVTISGDGLGTNQPLTVRFRTAGGNVDARYCDTTGPLTIPSGTIAITVWASPFFGSLYVCDKPAYPVTGTITAEFA